MQLSALLKVPLNVFDGDGCVVNKNSNGQRQAPERHNIDGLVQKAQDHDGGQNREGNGDGYDYSAAPASQKDENHQAGKSGSNHRFSNHTVDCAAHKDRLIGKGLDFELGWKRLGHAREDLPDAFDDVDG